MTEPQQRNRGRQRGSDAGRGDSGQAGSETARSGRAKTAASPASGRAKKATPVSGRVRAVGVPVSAGLRRIAVDPGAAAVFSSAGPVARLVEVLGNNVLAAILGVSRSQPSRWKQGSEQPGPESRRRISDLDHVLDRLLMELYPDQVGVWLTSPNPHLGSARPVDVLELRGAATVLPAVDALAQGTFV
jgi:uncharacterized protein (DUF2384 family)